MLFCRCALGVRNITLQYGMRFFLISVGPPHCLIDSINETNIQIGERLPVKELAARGQSADFIFIIRFFMNVYELGKVFTMGNTRNNR